MVFIAFDIFSVVFKAGLEIGEMILAVNKDSLLGSNYDTVSTIGPSFRAVPFIAHLKLSISLSFSLCLWLYSYSIAPSATRHQAPKPTHSALCRLPSYFLWSSRDRYRLPMSTQRQHALIIVLHTCTHRLKLIKHTEY